MADSTTVPTRFVDRVRDALARGLPLPTISGAADDPTKPDPDKPDPDKPDPEKPDAEQVREMRAALKKANKEAADLRAKFKEVEDRDKSEGERATAASAEAEKRAAAAEARALRMEVANAKGLTPALAKRLVGDTKEELEEDAAEILEVFKPVDGTKPPPGGGKPTENLKSGGDPSEVPEENDPRKIAAAIPRDAF